MVSAVNRVAPFPLQGRTVLVTRTEQGNAVERKKLEALGAKVVEFSGIEISEPEDKELLVETM